MPIRSSIYLEVQKNKYMGKRKTIFEAAREIVMGEQIKMTDQEIQSEQNAFHLVKALDLIDECYHYLKVNPPDKTKMSYSRWQSLVEETNYMREFNPTADHERHNKSDDV